MVVKKKIYYGGFHGLLPPVIPKAPRSLRRRSLNKKPSEDGEICAFELLAAVAGKLLQEQESESSTSSTGSKGKEQVCIPNEGVKHAPLEVEYKVNVSPERSEPRDQGSGVDSDPVAQSIKLDVPFKELPHSENDSGSEHASIVTNSDFIKKGNTDLITEAIEDKPGNLCDVIFGNRAEIHPAAIDKLSGGLTSDVKAYKLKGQVESCVKKHLPNKSSSNVHLSFYKDPAQNACFLRRRGNVNVSSRDDDEKYFRYNNRSTRRRGFGPRSRAGYKRIRKMMSFRYWKASPKLKAYEFADNTSGGVKSFYHKRQNIFMRDRCQTDAPSKRRKLFHHSSKTSFIKEASGGNISNSVKFSIKSFKVPELFVEVPETATVGSLKRSVMEAVTAILQGKLHVGVLLQGKKVRDDNRTLQQTGISQNCNLETLGFTLEPSLPEPCPSLVQKEIPLLLSRSPSSPTIDPGFSSSSPDPPPLITTMESSTKKNQGSTTLPAEVTTEERMMDSKALVVVPPVDAEVLSIVPLSEKPIKRYELSQRRTRRPFSVTEVEALVEAVETLGAGRWRDVKMRAFDDANHRTYVDLKDKWKTLVHTASIAPQQRRGEPVPQDLLDRVLAAHAYWSQHQSKQLVKHQKTLEAPM